MSYDLYFWRQTRKFSQTGSEIVDLLSADKPVPGIEAFSRERVRAVLRRFFPDIVDGDFQLDWEGKGSYFQISFAHSDEKHVHLIVVNCGHELLKAPEVPNRITEACGTLGCALFDPQSGKRYEQPDPE